MDAALALALLKEPRTRVAIATVVGSSPLIWGGLVWVSKLSFQGQLVIGILMGLATMASFHFMAVHRSQTRRHKAVIVQQLAVMDAAVLRRLFPGSLVPSWIQHITDLERVSWLNRELEEVWSCLDEAASEMLDAQLQPVLDQYAFGPIQKIDLKSLTLGKVAPLIGGVKFTPVGNNEAMLEMEIDWRHGRDQRIVLDVKSAGPDFNIEVKNLKFQGVLRIIMKPLTDQLPCFGAAVVSLREDPMIDFSVKFLGGDMLQLPGVDGMIDEIIRTAVSDMLVWPSRMIFPILPGDYSFLELRPVAYLEVKLIEGKRLLNKEIFGKSDPFVYVFVRQKKELMQRTVTKSNTRNPTWNQNFVLDVEDPDTQKLHFKVMDSDKMDSSDFLGLAEVPISTLEPNVEKDMWLKLIKDPKLTSEEKDRGDLHVIVTFKPYKAPEKGDGPKELLPAVPEGAGIAKESSNETRSETRSEAKQDVSTPTAPETNSLAAPETNSLAAPETNSVDANSNAATAAAEESKPASLPQEPDDRSEALGKLQEEKPASATDTEALGKLHEEKPGPAIDTAS